MIRKFNSSQYLFIIHIFITSQMALGGTLPVSDIPFSGKIGRSAKDSIPDWPEPVASPKGSPNIVLILLDDVGYGASEVFGGPVHMPELQKLAMKGLRYNRFHVSALCSPTRAALLSGRNDHQVGFGLVADHAKGFPGYNSIWPKSVAPVSEVLRRNGYSTAAFGKWHNTPLWEINPVGPFDRWPTGLGFEYFYGFMQGYDSQWEPSRLYRNTVAIEPSKTPKEGYHFTTNITDEAINWLHTHEALAPEKPYFLYFATGATHAPFHVPREWAEKYKGKFNQGWDELREKTFKRQKKLGVIPANAELTPRPKEFPAWNSLSEDQRKISAREMELFAGFLAHTDHEIGRLLHAIKQGEHANNTLIIYIVGDNGAGGIPEIISFSQNTQERLKQMGELGGPQSSELVSYTDSWAWATNTPFQGKKFFASHLGGTRVPMIISWPSHIKDHGGLRSQFTHANDVAATLYDITHIKFPKEIDGIKQVPLAGVSFLNTLERIDAPSRHRIQIFEQAGNRAIYQDGWIAASAHSSVIDQMRNPNMDMEKTQWELYNLDQDFSQARNLAAEYPRKLDELKALFDSEAHKNKVYPILNYFDRSMERPTDKRRDFIYRPTLPRIPGWAVPSFTRSSYSFTADVVIPDSGANGVILFYGNKAAGFTLYIKDHHLIYENRSISSKSSDIILSRKPIPRGRVNLTLIIERDKDFSTAKGNVRMYFDKELVGEGAAIALDYNENFSSFGVGQAFRPSFSSAFEPPYKFSGCLKKVRLKIL